MCSKLLFLLLASFEWCESAKGERDFDSSPSNCQMFLTDKCDGDEDDDEVGEDVEDAEDEDIMVPEDSALGFLPLPKTVTLRASASSSRDNDDVLVGDWIGECTIF